MTILLLGRYQFPISTEFSKNITGAEYSKSKLRKFSPAMPNLADLVLWLPFFTKRSILGRDPPGLTPVREHLPKFILSIWMTPDYIFFHDDISAPIFVN